MSAASIRTRIAKLQRQALELGLVSDLGVAESVDFARARVTGVWSARHVAILLRDHAAEHRQYIAGFAARRCLERETNGPSSTIHLVSAAQLVTEIASYPPDEAVPAEVLRRFESMVVVPLRWDRKPRNEYDRNARFDLIHARAFAKIVGGVDGMPFRQWLHERRTDWPHLIDGAERLYDANACAQHPS